jgi:carbon-monoxide dehydrogenase medium subunit
MRDYEFITARHFEYFEPADMGEALALLDEHGPAGAKVLAGGQSLMVMMRRRAVMPPVLIDVKRIAELSGIEERDGGLVFGATTLLDDVVGSELVERVLPGLADVAGQMGSIQILNRATVGGAICHADPSFDLTPALAALEARAVIRSSAGTREVPVEEVASGRYENQLQPNELLVSVVVPAQPEGSLFGFANFRRRGGEMPLAQAGVRVTLGGGRAVADARIVVGGAGPVPVRSARAEDLLRAARLDDAAASRAGAQAEADAQPFGDVRGDAQWRSALVGTVVKRALLAAAR